MLNKTLINFRPFFFTAVSVALGIGAGFLFYFDRLFLGILLCFIFLLFVVFVILFSGGEIKPKIFFSVAFILIFIFGAGAFCVQVDQYENANLEGHYYSVKGKVVSSCKTDYGQKLTLDDVNIDGNRTGKLKYNVSAYVYGESSFCIGDIVEFDCYLYDSNAIYEDRLSATNIERGIKYTATVNSEDVLKIGSSLTVFEKVNLFIRSSIQRGMDEQAGAVAIGMLLGSTEEMDEDVLGSYRSAGVAHVFAVSGLHVGFLATALNYLFNKLKVKRVLKAVIITLALLFYSGVCGFSASSLRASVMCAVLLFSSVKGNRYDGLTSVGIACTLILICSPINMFCVGFQLSFAVVLGIILLSSPIAKTFSFLPRRLARALGTVVSAQLVGIPICIYAFGQFSTVSILANLIFVPIVGKIFVFLFVSAIVGGFGIANIALHVPNYVFKGINFIITAIDYQWFIVGGVVFGGFAIFYYLALVTPCGLINLKKSVKIIATVCLSITFTVGVTVLNVNQASIPKAYVIGDDKICATVVKGVDENIMIVNSADYNFSLNRLKRLSQKEGITDLNTVIITASIKDFAPVLTKLNEVFELDKVCYYGVTDTVAENIIRNAMGLNVRSFGTSEWLNTNIQCAYELEGYVTVCTVNGYKLAFFSEFGKSYAGYKGLMGEYDYIVATDYVDAIFSVYQPKEFISYRYDWQFKNAYDSGTVTLKLK